MSPTTMTTVRPIAVALPAGRRRERRNELLAGLLSEDTASRTRSVQEARDCGLFDDGPVRLAVTVLSDLRPPAHREVEGALRSVAHLLPERRSHVVISGAQAVLLTIGADDPITTTDVVADRLSVALRRMSDPPPTGVGALQPNLARAWQSYRQAALACRLSRHEGRADNIVSLDQLGAYRALLSLPHPIDLAMLHPGVADLAGDADATPLLDTVEAFLDEGASAGRTATRLHLHRQSVYYRLKRFSDLAGCDLRDGTERLTVHLALKARRLR